MTATLHLVENDYNSVTKNDEWLNIISDVFADYCGFHLNPSQQRTVKYFLDHGNDPVLLLQITDLTSTAFRPSFRYFEAVIRNLNNAGIFDVNSYLDKGEECRQKYMQKKSLHYI